MVDALSRARRWARPPHGAVIDLRPADVEPDVELGLTDGTVTRIGPLVVDEERRQRHRAADAAVRESIARGLFTVSDPIGFAFFYYPDSPDELRDYIATHWRHTRFDRVTHARTVAALGAHPGARLWLREQVGIRTLRPLQ